MKDDCTSCHGHGDILSSHGTLVWSECSQCGVNQNRPVTREDIQQATEAAIEEPNDEIQGGGY